MKRAISGIVLTIATVSANAVTGPIFFDGKKFLAEPELERLMYLTGVMDGLIDSPLLYADVDSTSRQGLAKCMREMNASPGQVNAIVHNYLKSNPELWSYAMPSLLLSSMAIACKKIGSSIN